MLRGKLCTDHALDLIVADEHERATKGAENVGAETLEHRAHTLVLRDLDEAVEGALVKPLLLRLLRLHLQPTAHGVEGIRDEAGNDCGGLSNSELRGKSDEALLLLEGVLLLQRIEDAEIWAAVGDNANNRDTEAVVHGHDATTSSCLHQAINKASELWGARANIRSQPGTRIVEWVNNRQRASASKATRCKVRGEELPEFGLRVILREHSLNGVLKGEVESLGGEIANHVDSVATPEGTEALLR
mmetsp:Transcript_28667/g.61684  ORF Transcript_28667/g.61684 Transcript_28667/m.61684 type:complete len:245 (-) Transcript_28667:336-1070(-)